MAKCVALLALLFVGGFALPASMNDGPGFDDDMAEFFTLDESDFEAFIVGGNTAPEGAYPWMVALTNGPNRSFLCGASLVTNNRVISAAHCIRAAVNGNVISSTLRGTVGTNVWNRGGTTFNIRGFRNHAQFNPSTLKNDIGVLLTANNIAMTNRISTIPLSFDFVGGNVPCRVSGWGNIRLGGPMSQNLQEIRKNTVTGQQCVAEITRISQQLNIRSPPVDPNLEICTFLGVNRGTCHGDSGSPLVRNSNNHQIGVVAWGLPCARGAPDVFVRISAFRSWLNTNLR